MKDKLFAVYACFGIDIEKTIVVMPVANFRTAIELALNDTWENFNFASQDQFIVVIEIELNKFYGKDLTVDYYSIDKLPNTVVARKRMAGKWVTQWLNVKYRAIWDREKTHIDEKTARENTKFVKMRENDTFVDTQLSPFDYERVCLVKADSEDGLDLMRAWDGDYLHADADGLFLGHWGGNKL